jgi:penicillin-binding protein-related factor A (putative recombinase)
VDGKTFEKLLQESCELQLVDCARLRDAGWQGEQTQRRFTIKNICDFILFADGCIVYVECKHAKERLELSRLTQQADLIKKLSQSIPNLFAGYLLHIAGETYFISAAAIDKFVEKKSINKADAKKLGFPVRHYIPHGKRKERLDIESLIHELKLPF